MANYEQNNYKLANINQQDGKLANSRLQIFTDENGTESSNQQQEIIQKLPTNNQENQGKAGRWCDHKIKSGAKPRLNQPQSIKFEIYENKQEEGNLEKMNEGQLASDELKSRQTSTQSNAKLKEIKKEEKSPRLVIFEKLAPNQRFYCDLKKIYCGGTEYSFEEIRIIRLKLTKKRDEERNSKDMLKKEVEDLKKQISDRDNLFNDVEKMKKKLELLIKQSGNKTDEVYCKPSSDNRKQQQATDPFEQQHCTSEKQRKLDNLLNDDDQNSSNQNKANLVSKFNEFKLNTFKNSISTNYAKVIKKDTDEFEHKKNDDLIGFLDLIETNSISNANRIQFLNTNQQQQQQNSPQVKDRKEDLTIVRDLWNGSIEYENTVDLEKEMIKKPQSNNFSIFKDDDLIKLHNLDRLGSNKNQEKNDFCINQTEDVNTIALPHGDFDFLQQAKHASTPANFLPSTNSISDENCTINIYECRQNRLLSPIKEVSKEFSSHTKSSSSSSYLSGFSSSSYLKSRTFHK